LLALLQTPLSLNVHRQLKTTLQGIDTII